MRKGMKANRMSKQQYMRRLARKGLSKAQREGLWKGYRKICTSKPKRKRRTVRRNPVATPNRSTRKTARKSPKRKVQRRVYGKGKYRALRARIGTGRPRQTYAYQTPSGTVRKIPKHGYLGYASSAEMRATHRKDPKRAERDDARWARAMKKRERASISAVEGRGSAGLFTPNRRRRRPTRTITFEEWEKEMKQNRRRRKKTAKKKRTRRNVTQVAANRRRRKGTRKGTRKATRRRVRRNAPKLVANRRRKTSTKRRRVAGRRRSTVGRRKTSRGRVRRNAGFKMNRRKRSGTHRRRRVYRRTLRNQAQAFGKQLVQVLKIGGVVVVGYIGHRALTRVVSDSLLSKITSLQSGTGAAYRDVLAGALVAAVGVPVAAKVAPGDSKMIGAGMAASFLQSAIVTLLSQFGQESVAAYLGDYTNAEGSAQYSGYGSYYEFTPGQVYGANGLGEYYSAPGMSGFGQVPQLYQAAAGQYPGVAHLSQEAAGFGQGEPLLTQAAAGAGEYIVSGAQGIGEYEEVVPQYQRPVQTDEGISPDLSSAERALSIAEAAAGVGGTNLVPLRSTVYPTGRPEAIPDMPGGSRAGIFAGENGTFG